jgi:hypothetical protein
MLTSETAISTLAQVISSDLKVIQALPYNAFYSQGSSVRV